MSSPAPPPKARSLRKLVLGVVAAVSTALADELQAPAIGAGPVNQLEIAGNACGPAALLASIRCGDARWQELGRLLPGETDRDKLRYVIQSHGLTDSASLRGRKRWSRDGINPEDLADVAGELAALRQLPAPEVRDLFRRSRETPAGHLKRIHGLLAGSLKRGLPPVLSLRRYVQRGGRWESVQSHFVTVVGVPKKLPRGDASFSFTYFDPWGGRRAVGHLALPAMSLLADPSGRPTSLVALVPDADVGSRKVRAGEPTAVVPAVAIGRW